MIIALGILAYTLAWGIRWVLVGFLAEPEPTAQLQRAVEEAKAKAAKARLGPCA